MTDSRRAEGAARRARAQGERSADLQRTLASLDSRLADVADDFVFGQVWAGSALSERERMLVALGMLSVQPAESQLRVYLHGALQAGVSEETLREVLFMALVYGGMPRSLNAFVVLSDVLAAEERRRSRKDS